MADLGGYIREAVPRRWAWGSHDCCTFVAGWAILSGAPDPMAFIRGRYDSELTALRRIREGGGLADLWAAGCADAGLESRSTVRAGDIGVIARATECGTDEAAAIWTGERWVSLGLAGIVAGPAEIVRAWAV